MTLRVIGWVLLLLSLAAVFAGCSDDAADDGGDGAVAAGDGDGDGAGDGDGDGDADSDASVPAGDGDGDAPVEEDPCDDGFMRCNDDCIEVIEPVATAVQDAILFNSCARSQSCHTGANPKEKLGIETLDKLLATVGTPSVQDPARNLIVAGDPDASFIVDKLRGRNLPDLGDPNKTSQQMPRLSPPLCDALIDVVEQWIADGALDNR